MANYPDKVNEYLEKWLPTIKEMFEEDELFVSDEITKKAIEKVIGPLALKRFLQDGEVVLQISEEEGTRLLRNLIAEAAILSLSSKGLVDTMENEHGEEIIFLTKDGKELAEKMTNDKKI